MKSDMLTFFVSVYMCLFNYAPLDKMGLEWIKAEGLLDGLEGLEVGAWTSLVVDTVDTWVRFSASSWFLFSSRLGKGNILLRFFTGNEKIMNKKNMFKRTNPPLKKNKKCLINRFFKNHSDVVMKKKSHEREWANMMSNAKKPGTYSASLTFQIRSQSKKYSLTSLIASFLFTYTG